jgi:hypothetical protein
VRGERSGPRQKGWKEMPLETGYANIASELVKSIVWPIVAIYALRIFREDIAGFVAKAKEFSVKVAGVEVKFSGSEAGTLLADVLSEVDKATRDFGDAEWRLFDAIATSPKSVTVALITQKVFGKEFRRNSDNHEIFRKLRNASLIRPDEGSTWQPEKHAGLTTLGRLVEKNRDRPPARAF